MEYKARDTLRSTELRAHCCSRHGALGIHLFIFDMVSELYLFCQFGVSGTIDDNLGFSTPKFKVRGLV